MTRLSRAIAVRPVNKAKVFVAKIVAYAVGSCEKRSPGRIIFTAFAITA